MLIKNKIKNLILRNAKIEVKLSTLGPNELLAGKNAVVVGGTSGIGLAIAKKIYEAGGKVVLVGHNSEKMQAILSENRSFDFRGIISDVSMYSDCLVLPDKVEDVIGGAPDIVIYAAGIISKECLTTDFLSIDENTWRIVMDTNIKGMFFVYQSFIRLFLEEKKQAHILGICSTEGLHGVVVPYGISKWGSIGLTKGLGKRYAKDGIIINGIAPGGTATELLGFHVDSDYRWPVASGRVSLPDEIGNLAVYMCSDMGSNMIGTVVVHDGGESLL